MTDLITLEIYKELKGITNDKDDLKLDRLIEGVSQLIKTYCNRSLVDFASANKTEIFDIVSGQCEVPLKEFPIIEIVSVEERTSYNSSYVAITAAAYQFYHDTNLESIKRTNSAGTEIAFPAGPGAVKVVYKGGYTTLPSDLLLAVADLVTYYYKDEYKSRRVMGNATLSGAEKSSVPDTTGFPDHITRILNFYKV